MKKEFLNAEFKRQFNMWRSENIHQQQITLGIVIVFFIVLVQPVICQVEHGAQSKEQEDKLRLHSLRHHHNRNHHNSHRSAKVLNSNYYNSRNSKEWERKTDLEEYGNKNSFSASSILDYFTTHVIPKTTESSPLTLDSVSTISKEIPRIRHHNRHHHSWQKPFSPYDFYPTTTTVRTTKLTSTTESPQKSQDFTLSKFQNKFHSDLFTSTSNVTTNLRHHHDKLDNTFIRQWKKGLQRNRETVRSNNNRLKSSSSFQNSVPKVSFTVNDNNNKNDDDDDEDAPDTSSALTSDEFPIKYKNLDYFDDSFQYKPSTKTKDVGAKKQAPNRREKESTSENIDEYYDDEGYEDTNDDEGNDDNDDDDDDEDDNDKEDLSDEENHRTQDNSRERRKKHSSDNNSAEDNDYNEDSDMLSDDESYNGIKFESSKSLPSKNIGTDIEDIYSRSYVPGTLTQHKFDTLGTHEAVSQSRKLNAALQARHKVLANAHATKIFMEASCKVPKPKIERIQKDPGKTYIPHCTILHRCGDDTGCCNTDTLTCVPKHTQNVDLYFFVKSLRDKQGTIEKYTFINHTECHCVDRSRYALSSDVMRTATVLDCNCPRLFEKVLQENGYCRCDCSSGNSGCDWLKRGMEHFSMVDRKCITEGRCKSPTCEYGTYIKKFGRCPRKDDSSHSRNYNEFIN